MINLNLYSIFCCVAKEGNISKASELLYISQPAVSFSIKELERQLNQQLFIRKSKGVELTPFGKDLYGRVSGIIDKFDEAEKLSKMYDKLQTGIIRIGSNSSNVNQILLDYLTIFANKYPDVQIVMERDNADRLISKLENNDLDMIFVDNSPKCKEFNLIKNFEVTYQLIGNKKFKEKYPTDDIDLNNFPTNELMLPSINNNSRIAIDKYFKDKGITINPKYELDNYILLYDFVKRGFGMAFVSVEYYKDAVNNHEVEVIYPNFTIKARDIVCLTNCDSTNKALSKLIDIIK